MHMPYIPPLLEPPEKLTFSPDLKEFSGLMAGGQLGDLKNSYAKHRSQMKLIGQNYFPNRIIPDEGHVTFGKPAKSQNLTRVGVLITEKNGKMKFAPRPGMSDHTDALEGLLKEKNIERVDTLTEEQLAELESEDPITFSGVINPDTMTPCPWSIEQAAAAGALCGRQAISESCRQAM